MRETPGGFADPPPARQDLIGRIVANIIDFSMRFAWTVIVVAFLAAAAGAYYMASHFVVNANTDSYIPKDLPWRKTQTAVSEAFPQTGQQEALIVIDAATPELARVSAKKLAAKLEAKPQLFKLVERPGSGPYFEKNALLFQPVAQLKQTLASLGRATPLLATLAADPSLRGIADALSVIPQSVRAHRAKFADFERQMAAFSNSLERVLTGQPAYFSWQNLLSGKTANSARQFIIVQAALNYAVLEPGRAVTDFIRRNAKDLGLQPAKGVTVRITGPVPIADQEFATIREGWGVTGLLPGLVVLLITWVALRSLRIVFAVGVTVVLGLAMTAGIGLFMVTALNLVSVAFAVLFVGIGADFGIQYSMRYRSVRYEEPQVKRALHGAGIRIGRPLAVAAAAATAGFYSFLPTNYKGISELGLIAGTGMIIAFLTAISVLPALLSILGSPPEHRPIGFKFLAPVDDFTSRHRHFIVFGTLVVVLGCLPLLTGLRFDFNPFHLDNPKNPAIATLTELMREHDAPVNRIQILAPSLAATEPITAKLRALPEVAGTLTLNDLIPTDQDQKLPIIQAAAAHLLPLLNSPRQRPPPSDPDDVAALKAVADQFAATAGNETSQGGEDARYLADLLRRLAAAPAQTRAAAAAAFLPGLQMTLGDLRLALQPTKSGLAQIPAELKRDWISADGRARIEVLPKGDPNNDTFLTKFVNAVTRVVPDATGEPVAIQKSGEMVIRSFIEAAIWALLSIAALLFVTLRRFSDVLLTLVPLLLAALVTLEITSIIRMPLNFVNIIAFPLLLGLGVAFKIYFMMAWRAGTTKLLQSSLTRAVFFSAMTTATAFGSLWLSRDPGLSSMGELLAISLATTLAAAVLFQPALMGPPRRTPERAGPRERERPMPWQRSLNRLT